ncbi:hypothetical protein Agub_g12981 [Astrephomene gubernaculifera]|uniref:PAS domain-containing protein n=1 Tax=Astrephomene gubernaculifera TaxID=47775 RepID=A0AAD3E140_9CHLO|nr:hypothetical protein Agub_g12981 [Astrephomene gubernaculifera]
MGKLPGRGSLVSEQLSDVGSTASSSAGRRVASLPLRDALDGDERGDDDVATTAQAVELAIFGVLYTLSKEKVDGSKWIALLKMVLDFLQQLVVLLSPTYGWFPWASEWTSKFTWLWEGLSYLDFRTKLSSMNYSMYTGFLYAVALLLLCSLGLCAYVGYCFKRHKFAYVWPVWTLRVVVSMFFQTFYVSACGIFLSNINCHWLAPDESNFERGYLDKYPDKRCLDYPYVFNMLISIFLLVLFSAIVFVTTAADFELDPLADGLLAAAHPHVELLNLAAKTVFLLASAILVVDVPKLQAIVFAATMALQFYTTARWVPFLTAWMNHVRAGFNLGLTWVSVMMVVLRCVDSAKDSHSHMARRLTYIALLGIPGTVAAGIVISWIRLNYFVQKALRAFQNAQSDSKPRDIYEFIDMYEVEVVARVCRTPGQESGTQDEASVKLSERILKAGIVLFPNESYVHVLYSNLLIEVQTLYQAGQSQLMAAKKLNPGYVQKFAIFVREQQHMQRAHTQTTGESAVDLVSYVEFQRNYRLLARATQRALTTQQAFWRLLLHGQIHFSQLTSAFNNIEAAQKTATQTYRMVLDRYPNSVKLLRSYARFQEEVMNNPWRASQLYEKADRLEEQQAAAQDTILYSVDNKAMLTQVDDKAYAVLVINAAGIIQMSNKTLQKLFGYKASELDGQSVSMLMPAPFSSRHQGYMGAYLATGRAKILGTVRQVVALHRRRYMFPIRLAVTKLSGQGQDSTFMGVMRAIEADASTIQVWCLTSGVTLSVDQRFQDVFGVPPVEVVGRNFKDLVVEQDELQELMNMALACPEDELAAQGVTRKGLHVQHKYASLVQVDITIQRGGTADEPLHIVNVTPVTMTAPPLVVFNRSGNIVFASSAMSQLLGFTPRSLGVLTSEALMPPHYQMLHSCGIREMMQHKSPHTCRNGQTVFMCSSNKVLVPVRLSISHKAEGEENLLTVVEVTKSSIEAGLDERRIKLEVSPNGEVLSLISTSCSPALFGIMPEHLVGTNVFKFFPELAAAAQSEEEQEDVLEALRLMSIERLAPVYIRTKFGTSQVIESATADLWSTGATATKAYQKQGSRRSEVLLTTRHSQGDTASGEAAADAPPDPHPTATIRSAAAGSIGQDSTTAPKPVSSGSANATATGTLTSGPAGGAATASGQHDINASTEITIEGRSSAPLIAAVRLLDSRTDGGGVEEGLGLGLGGHHRWGAMRQRLTRYQAPSPVERLSGDPLGSDATVLAQRVLSSTMQLRQVASMRAGSSEAPPPAPPLLQLLQSQPQQSQQQAADLPSPNLAAGSSSFAQLPSGRLLAGSGSRTISFNAIAAAALARSRLAAKAGRLQRQNGQNFGLPPRPVILEVDGTSGEDNLVISIWHPDKVAAMLEVSKDGDIRQAMIDELHPPGPMFGVSSTALTQFNLRDVLCIPQGTSIVDFLFASDKSSPAGKGHPAPHRISKAKQSSNGGVLKSSMSHRKNRTPGPVLYITTRHADGRPLHLSLQALPKKTSASSMFIRAHLYIKSNVENATPAGAFNAALGALCGPGTLVRTPAAANPAAAPGGPVAAPPPVGNTAAAHSRLSPQRSIPLHQQKQQHNTQRAHTLPQVPQQQQQQHMTSLLPQPPTVQGYSVEGRTGAAGSLAAAAALQGASARGGGGSAGAAAAGDRGPQLTETGARFLAAQRMVAATQQHPPQLQRDRSLGTSQGLRSPRATLPASLQEWQDGGSQQPVDESQPLESAKLLNPQQPSPASRWSVAFNNSLFVRHGSGGRRPPDDQPEGAAEAAAAEAKATGGQAHGASPLRQLRFEPPLPPEQQQQQQADVGEGKESPQQPQEQAGEREDSQHDSQSQGLSSPRTMKSDCLSGDEDDPVLRERLEALATLGPAADEASLTTPDRPSAPGMGPDGRLMDFRAKKFGSSRRRGPWSTAEDSTGGRHSHRRRPTTDSNDSLNRQNTNSERAEGPVSHLPALPEVGAVASVTHAGIRVGSFAATIHQQQQQQQQQQEQLMRGSAGTAGGGGGGAAAAGAANLADAIQLLLVPPAESNHPKMSLTAGMVLQESGLSQTNMGLDAGTQHLRDRFTRDWVEGTRLSSTAASDKDPRSLRYLQMSATGANLMNTPVRLGPELRRSSIYGGEGIQLQGPTDSIHQPSGILLALPPMPTASQYGGLASSDPPSMGLQGLQQHLQGGLQNAYHAGALPSSMPGMQMAGAHNAAAWGETSADPGYAQVAMYESLPVLNAAAAVASASARQDGATDVVSELESSYLGVNDAPVADSQRQADFQRGKRLRRISKVLERPQARNAINRFWNHSRLIALLLTASHLACAIGIFILLSKLSTCVRGMSRSGVTLDFMHRAAVASRVLDQLHKNRTQDPLYLLSDMDAYQATLGNATDEFERRHVEAYLRFGKAGSSSLLGRLWEDKMTRVSLLVDPSSTPPTYSTALMSLFDMGKQFVDSARDIQANHRHYVDELSTNLTDTGSFRYIHQEAIWHLTDAYVEMLDTLVLKCIDQADLVNRVMLALLVVEACCICGTACAYLSYRLMQVSKYRCSLFSVFLAIPSATIKTLASRRVDADGGDDSQASDDASQEGGAAQKGATANHSARRRSVVYENIPTFTSARQLQAQDDPGVARRLPLASRSPPGLRTSFVGVGNVGLHDTDRRPLGGEGEPGARRLGRQVTGPLGGGGGGEDGVRFGGGGAGMEVQPRMGSRSRRYAMHVTSHLHSDAPSGMATSKRRGGADGGGGWDDSSTGISTDASPVLKFRTAAVASLRRAGTLMAVKSQRVAELMKKRLVAGTRHAVQQTSRFFRRKSKMAGTNKVLVAHSLQNWWLVLPIMVWAVLIISLYAVSYNVVGNVYQPTETLNVANFNVWRVSRLSYFAHELNVLENRALLDKYREYLLARRLTASLEWDVLLYGSKRFNESIYDLNLTISYHRIGPSDGIAHSGGLLGEMLFETTQCMRYNESSCFPVGHPYYAATHQGMSTIMRTMLRECDLLLADPDEDVNLQNPHLSFAFQVGLNDARDGLLRVRDYYEGMLMDRIHNVRAIHVGLLVASFVLILLFMFYLVRPFVRYTREEAKHIAKLLSELGQDIDVERLVENALKVGRPPSQNGKGEDKQGSSSK